MVTVGVATGEVWEHGCTAYYVDWQTSSEQYTLTEHGTLVHINFVLTAGPPVSSTP